MLIKLLLIDNNLDTAGQAIALLEQLEHTVFCGIAASYEHSVYLIEHEQPDIVLLELTMMTEQGVHIASSLKQQFPHVHIIVYTRYDYEPFFNQLIEYGVSGMLYKTASAEQLQLLIYNVLHGNTVVPLPLYRQFKLHRSEQLKHYWELDITPFERHLLGMIDKRYTNALIAKLIHVSESSVEKYLSRLYDKLGVRNKNQAIERMQRDRCLRPIAPTDHTLPQSLANHGMEVVEHEHLQF